MTANSSFGLGREASARAIEIPTAPQMHKTRMRSRLFIGHPDLGSFLTWLLFRFLLSFRIVRSRVLFYPARAALIGRRTIVSRCRLLPRVGDLKRIPLSIPLKLDHSPRYSHQTKNRLVLP